MPLAFAAGISLFAVVALQGQTSQQETAPQVTQPSPAPSNGTVVMERHQPSVEIPAEKVETQPPPASAAKRSRKVLRQRSAPVVAADAPQQQAVQEPSSAVSSSVDAAQALSPLAEAVASMPTDNERRAVQVRGSNLDLHLNQHTGEVTVRARLQMHNGGTVPLTRLPLQISSALRWQSGTVRLEKGEAASLAFEQHRLNTDADHTGAAAEAVFTLNAPLAPSGDLSLEVFYGGTIQPSAERLVRLGAPEQQAAQSDWDGVNDTFTGLRGFGNVLWFPVATSPVFLADGAAFASAVEAQRAQAQTVSLRLTVENQGTRAAQAFFLGHKAELTLVSELEAPDGQEEERTVVQTAEWPSLPVATHPVSLFLTALPAFSATESVAVTVQNAAAVSAYRAAAERVQPLLRNWLGAKPAEVLSVVDLPVLHGQPFADGALLVLPVAEEDPRVLAPALVYPMASAWLGRGLPTWLQDGLPEFLRLLYLEQTGGHDSLLAALTAGGSALSLSESFRTDASPALAHCADATCDRIKAAYVFIMLRQLAGEQALQQAVTALLQHQGAAEGASARLLALLNQSSGKDFTWFFQDWVEHDKGLPDLSIVSVAPRRVERSLRTDYLPSQRRPVSGPIGAEPVAQAGDPQKAESATEASRHRVAPAEGSWLVAVEVRNDGDAAAEVPVTVRSAGLQNTLNLRIAAHSRATVRVPFEAAPEEVWVNDGSTPEMRSVTHHKSIEIPAEAR